jgi:hypothetical protein
MAAGSWGARIAKWAGPIKSTGVCIAVESKLALQGAIGDAAVLVQHGYHLAEDLIEGHSVSSLWTLEELSFAGAAPDESTKAIKGGGKKGENDHNSRPFWHSSSAASLIAENGMPDRSAISSRECCPSDRFNTHRRAEMSTPIVSPPVDRYRLRRPNWGSP